MVLLGSITEWAAAHVGRTVREGERSRDKSLPTNRAKITCRVWQDSVILNNTGIILSLMLFSDLMVNKRASIAMQAPKHWCRGGVVEVWPLAGGPQNKPQSFVKKMEALWL